MSWHDLILLSSLVGRCLRTCKGSCAVWRETQMTFSHWQFSCIFVGTAHAKLCSVPTCAQKDTKRIADEAIRFQEGASLTECLSIFFGWRAVSSVCRHVGTKLWHTNYIRQKCLKTAVNVEFVIGPYIYILIHFSYSGTILLGWCKAVCWFRPELPRVFEHINRRHWMAHVSSWHREFVVVSNCFWEKICMAYTLETLG